VRRAIVAMTVAMTVAMAGAVTGPLAAQGVQSALTGISLPEGSKLDKGFLTRAAAKADMDMTAKDAGATLGSTYEVYRLGAIAGAPASFLALKTMVEGQGWSLNASPKGENWGWLDKGTTRFLLNFTTGKDGAWLYLAEVSQRTSSVASTPGNIPSGTRPTNNPPTTTPPTSGRPESPVVPAASGPKRFQFTRSEFDDGWVAMEQPDFVQVTKGSITAYLFYRVVMTDEMRPPMATTSDYFWNRDGRPRFDIRNANYRKEESSYPPLEYIEGDATDRATGKRAFVGMFVSRSSGGALNILVVAPDRGTFYQFFPKPQDLERMMTYNRFAASPADLVGSWSEASGAYAQMYYVQTGNYAGMNAAVSSAEFWIEPDGTYRSMHKGATGMVGSQKIFQQEYKGRWQMNGNWEVSMTNRFEGRTDTYLVQFEVVRGGRLLHLTDKAHPAMQYHLGWRP